MNNQLPPPLFSLGQVLTATFMGGPLGGVALLATNRQRLGHKEEVGTILFLGIGLLCLVLFLGNLLPNSLASLFYLAQLTLMRSWYSHEQSSLYDRALVNGGSKASWWSVVGFSLLALLFTFLPAMLIFPG